MTPRLVLLSWIVWFLSGCSFSLAQDVTPPPDYTPPPPPPTVGPAVPPAPPDLQRGAAIYAEKCAPCHGERGLGDGPQGKELPVSVPPLGLPQIGRAAVPAEWYRIVTQGNLERFMPPFTSLSVQERWDVVAYALTLHVSPAELERGRKLFEDFCSDCPLDQFRDQEWMAARSNQELARILQEGNGTFSGLNARMSDGFNELAAYVRTLSFAASSPDSGSAAAETDVSSAPATPAAELATPVPEATGPAPEATPATTAASRNVVRGVVRGGGSGLTVTLHGFEHTMMAGATSQEVLTLTTTTDQDGQYVFENLEKTENLIFISEVTYQGVQYISDSAFGASEVNIPPIQVYESTTDQSGLGFDQVHFFLNITDQTVQVVGLYTFFNTGDRTVVIPAVADVPFLPVPARAQNLGYELAEGSAPVLQAEGGFALPPATQPYTITHLYVLPYEKKVEIAQPFVWPARSVILLVPENVQVTTSQLRQGERQNFQGVNYNQFRGGPIQAGDTLTWTISEPLFSIAGLISSVSQQNLLFGMAGLGLALILTGLWLYFNNSRVTREEDEEMTEFESEEDILDAIIALDDLHRQGKIPEETYQRRREELKALIRQLRQRGEDADER